MPKNRIDLTKPVKTRCGLPVRILCTDRLASFPVVGLVLRREGYETCNVWQSDGRFSSAPSSEPHEDDLVNV